MYIWRFKKPVALLVPVARLSVDSFLNENINEKVEKNQLPERIPISSTCFGDCPRISGLSVVWFDCLIPSSCPVYSPQVCPPSIRFINECEINWDKNVGRPSHSWIKFYLFSLLYARAHKAHVHCSYARLSNRFFI